MTTDQSMVNAFVPGKAALTAREQDMIERRRRLLGPSYRLFYERPVHLVRGEGVWLFDEAGQAYLDCYNNVVSLGHCHPRVVEAMVRQASLLSTHTRYLHDGILDYAERLLATFPQGLEHLMFTCTGSEANDLALRAARNFTGGEGVIVTECAYHGVTEAVASISPSLGNNVNLGRTTRTVPAPDPYRGSPAEAATTFRMNIEHAINDLLRHGIRPAALILDTIFSSDGVFPHPAGCISEAVEAIHAAGGLFIADEVQSGFARTGDAMWGFERHSVRPDIVTMGKPMGNGYPVAGLAIRPEVVADFGAKARYFNTFGGNAVAAATALAVLDVIQEEKLQENAYHVGAYFRQRLEDIAERHEEIGDIRQAGLFLGIEVVKDRESKCPDAARTSDIVNGLRDKLVLISATGPRANVLKIRPPLVFRQTDADLFAERLEQVLSAP